jgi:hypothetical protein
MDKTPELYWVIGTGTSVGKTTISKALIQALNERNTPTLGFKPFGAFKLRENIDVLIDRYPKSRAALVGSDAMDLCLASPLTPGELIDVVGPSYRMCWSTWDKSLLLQTGSTILGNVEYFKSEIADELFGRPDFQRVFELSGLSRVIHNASLDSGRETQMVKIAMAFEYLAGLNPEVVVCEGAANLLPVWTGSPKPKKIFLMNYESVYVYDDIDIDPHQLVLKEGVLNIKDILPDLYKIKPKKSLLFFMGEENLREKIAKDLVRSLLDT